MKQVSFVLVFFLTSIYCNAEFIQGIVVDNQNNKPIGFVSIGILNSPIGTYSSEIGEFNLDIDEYMENDSLRFSCVGYTSISFNVSDYIKENRNSFDTIFLTEKIVELDEVVIYGSETKTLILGNRHATGVIKIGFFGDKELGTIIENDKNLRLKSVAFKLTMAKYQEPDSAIFRFNIYSLKDNLPDENILTKPIYFHIRKGQFHSKQSKFDISDHNIHLDGDFVASFELVKQYKGKRIYFTGKFFGCKTIYRKGQQAAWTEVRADGSPVSLQQSIEIEANILN